MIKTVSSSPVGRYLRVKILKRDQETHFNGFAKSGDSFEGNNVVDPRISSADKAIGSETSKSSERQQSLNFNPVTEMSGSSQGSYSSQSTSLNSSIQGNNAPVASMIDTSGFLGAASTESNNAGLTAHLPIPLTAPQLKRSYSTAIGKMCKGRRLNGKYDPENHEIMRLRQEENLDFQEIANKLNEARYKTGGKDELTDNAVYSRYTRNAPLIAQMRNEKFVPTAKVCLSKGDFVSEITYLIPKRQTGQPVYEDEIFKSSAYFWLQSS